MNVSIHKNDFAENFFIQPPGKNAKRIGRPFLAAGNELQQVQLHVLHRGHGPPHVLDTTPMPPGSQALLVKDEATSCVGILN